VVTGCIDGLSSSVHRAAIQNRLLLEIAAWAEHHSEKGGIRLSAVAPAVCGHGTDHRRPLPGVGWPLWLHEVVSGLWSVAAVADDRPQAMRDGHRWLAEASAALHISSSGSEIACRNTTIVVFRGFMRLYSLSCARFTTIVVKSSARTPGPGTM